MSDIVFFLLGGVVALVILGVLLLARYILFVRFPAAQAQIAQVQSEGAARNLSTLKSLATTAGSINSSIATLGQRFDQIRQDTIDTNKRLDEHNHPHTHDGVPEHVHWFRYNSTELTNGIRRDVYECMVPGCNKIAAHTPD